MKRRVAGVAVQESRGWCERGTNAAVKNSLEPPPERDASRRGRVRHVIAAGYTRIYERIRWDL